MASVAGWPSGRGVPPMLRTKQELSRCPSRFTAPPPPVVPSLTLSGDTLSWTPVEGATGYDVAAGNLIGLAEGGMSAATTGCVADDAPPSSILIGTVPPLGTGFWYLVRGVNCGGPGSYGAGDPPLPLSRDEAIALSGNDCNP